MRSILILLLILASPLAAARMYQWSDPDTGTPQLSGKPPYWYRGDEAGPRVYVIDNGKVVDDTAVKVPENERQQLRQAAFLRAEQDEANFQTKLEEEARLKSERQRNQQEEEVVAEDQPPAPPSAEALAKDEAATAEADAKAEEEAMRGLVQQWETIREDLSKKVVHE